MDATPKRIFSSHDLLIVHHWKNLLAAHGIRAAVRNEFLSSAMGELPPGECQIELWVFDARDAERATSLMREIAAAADAQFGGWRCPLCGEPGEAQFTQCWRCGTARTAP